MVQNKIAVVSENFLNHISVQTGIPNNDGIFNGKLRLHHILKVKNSNPNGDPNSSGPRIDSRGHGLVSPFSIKAVLRRIFEDLNKKILLNSSKLTIKNEMEAVGFSDMVKSTPEKEEDNPKNEENNSKKEK